MRSKPSVAKVCSVTQLIGMLIVVVLMSFLVLWLVLFRFVAIVGIVINTVGVCVEW